MKKKKKKKKSQNISKTNDCLQCMIKEVNFSGYSQNFVSR